MLLRVLTAAVLIPIVVAVVWWGPLVLLAAAAAILALIALNEFLNLGERVGLVSFRKWTFVCAAAIFYAQYSASFVETRSFGEGLSLVHNGFSFSVSVETVLLIFLLGTAGIALATRRPLHEMMGAISISSAGLLFVALPFSYLVRLSEVENIGRLLVLFTLCLIWAGDMLAYFVGRAIGRIPMAPVLSPKKTWEGAFANFIASLIVALLFAHAMQTDLVSLLVIAGFANIAGQMGDLLESAYKRGASVKDSSALLPGHGGMLDRIDSLILAGPVVWLAYQWLATR
jgi:phosphatidate cytidylyltransferase